MTDTDKTATKEKSYDGFTEEERAAMKERAQELKKAPRKKASKADGEADVMAKIAEMPGTGRTLFSSRAPTSSRRGMPRSALRRTRSWMMEPCGPRPSPSRKSPPRLKRGSSNSLGGRWGRGIYYVG